MSTQSLQLWPAGKCVEVKEEGDTVLVRFSGETDYRPPTADELRAVKIEQTAQRLWDRECYCCDSALVSDMLREASSGSLSRDVASEWDYEQCANLTTNPDGWDYDKCGEWVEERGIDVDDEHKPHVEVRFVYTVGEEANEPEEDTAYLPLTAVKDWGDEEAVIKAVEGATGHEVVTSVEPVDVADLYDAEGMNWDDDDMAERLQEVIRDNAESAEVMEWWRVSEWFGKRLAAEGEVVLSNGYGCWWGRCCTGQSVLMDGSIQQVAARLVDGR